MMYTQTPSGQRVMNLKQIAPRYEVVPPELYDGTESVVADLCNALIALDHEIAPFATTDERREARRVAAPDHGVRRGPRGRSVSIRAVFDRRFAATTRVRLSGCLRAIARRATGARVSWAPQREVSA